MSNLPELHRPGYCWSTRKVKRVGDPVEEICRAPAGHYRMRKKLANANTVAGMEVDTWLCDKHAKGAEKSGYELRRIL